MPCPRFPHTHIPECTMEFIHVSFTIPCAPLSTNMAYKLTSKGKFARMYLSEAAQEFKKLCSFAALYARPKGWPMEEKYSLTLDFYFKNQRPDSDGPLKLVLDAMQGCLYNNDRQVEEVTYRRRIDPAAPRVEVSISVRTQ